MKMYCLHETVWDVLDWAWMDGRMDGLARCIFESACYRNGSSSLLSIHGARKRNERNGIGEAGNDDLSVYVRALPISEKEKTDYKNS